MSDEVEPGLGERYRKASPWPLLVALGVVLSEVGVVLGVFAVAVGGLVLFGGTVAGVLRESGYVAAAAAALAVLGVARVGSGAAAVLLNVDASALSVGVLLDRTRPFVYRGGAIAAAGLIVLGLAGAVAGRSHGGS
jgi:hypothetical protein